MPIYTIGQGSRNIADFVGLLKQYEVAYLIDLRSRPYSLYNPDFSKDNFRAALKTAGIEYVPMGDTMGGQPDDRSLYDGDKVNYERYAQTDKYLQGIARLETAQQKDLTVALMCSEGKPQNCHRSKLVGRTLAEMNYEVRHIDELGQIKSQAEVMQLTGKAQNEAQSKLFELDQKELNFTSKKRYPKP